MTESAAIDDGTLLGGRVRHRQRRDGHRTGIEPVLLAAAVPARPGDRVIEAGTGSGAGLLCLAARVPGISGVGVERDPHLAALGGENARSNGFDALSFVASDIEAFAGGDAFDHAFANPPWHHEAGTPSPDPGRDAAKRGTAALLAAWAAALARRLRRQGTLTFITAAGVLPSCISAMTSSGCGSITVFPLWPRQGANAKLVIVQARRGARGAAALRAGLALHDTSNAFTQQTDAVLRGGAAIDI